MPTFPSLSHFYGFKSNSRPSISHPLSYAPCLVHSIPYFSTPLYFVKKTNLECPNCVAFSILLLFSLGQILSLVTWAQILVLDLKSSFVPLFCNTSFIAHSSKFRSTIAKSVTTCFYCPAHEFLILFTRIKQQNFCIVSSDKSVACCWIHFSYIYN